MRVGRRTPDAHAHTNLTLLLDLERIQMVIIDIIRHTPLSWRSWPQLLHMVTRLDINTSTLKLLHRIPREFLVKHRQHLLRNIVNSNLMILNEFRVQLLHILINQVVQLGTELDSRRPTPHNSKVEQLLLHLNRSSR